MARKGKKFDLIPELTTHKNDYKAWPLPIHEPLPRPLPDEEHKVKKPSKLPQIDFQSHVQYMKDVPFNLYFEAKPIIGKDPRDSFPHTFKSHDLNLKNDHFIFKIPGKPTADITEEEIVRNLLINTYLPVHNGIYKDACLDVQEPAESPQGVLINDNVCFQPELYPTLPPGWIDAAKHWDSLQSRILGDPTKTFWKRRGCEVESFSKSNYNDLIPMETKREIRNLIEADRLRLPFTVTKTGYRGYRQISAKGVPLRRNDDFDF